MSSYSPNTLWVSYSSINDFIRCPKLYYLKNIYKDPKTGYKLQIARPPTTMGDIVHKTIEALATKKVKRTIEDISACYERLWKIQEGIRGGFASSQEEASYKQRGLEMVKRFVLNWDLESHKPIFLNFPKAKLFYDIFLVGNVDWLEETEEGHFVMDFKTGAQDEKEDSLQLPIYTILVEAATEKKVSKWAYWYLRDNVHREVPMKDTTEALKTIRSYALQMKKFRDINTPTTLACNHAPREECNQIEQILKGNATFIYQYHDYKKDVYALSA